MGSQIHNYKPEFSWLPMGNQGKYHVFVGDFRKQSYVSQSHINFLVLDLWIWLLAFRMHKEQENKMDKQSLERKISYKLKIVFRIWELNLVKKKITKISSTLHHCAANGSSLGCIQKFTLFDINVLLMTGQTKMTSLTVLYIYLKSIDNFLYAIKGPKTHHVFKAGRYSKEKWKGQQETKWQSWKSS